MGSTLRLILSLEVN